MTHLCYIYKFQQSLKKKYWTTPFVILKCTNVSLYFIVFFTNWQPRKKLSFFWKMWFRKMLLDLSRSWIIMNSPQLTLNLEAINPGKRLIDLFNIDWLIDWFSHLFIACLIDTLNDWLKIDCLIDWLIDWFLIDWLIDWFTSVQEGQVEQLGEGLAAEAEKSLTNLLCFNMERVIRLVWLIMLVLLIRFFRLIRLVWLIMLSG